MNPDEINALLAKAERTVPPKVRSRPGRWVKLYPVFKALRTNGMTYVEAVNWLVKEKVVAKESFEKALHSFSQITHRINRKKKAEVV